MASELRGAIMKNEPLKYFIKGMANAFSVMPVELELLNQNNKKSFIDNDYEAIQSDWMVVGNDMRRVMRSQNVKQK